MAGPRCSRSRTSPTPSPVPRTRVVAVRATAVNRADLLQRMGSVPRAARPAGDPRPGDGRHRDRGRRAGARASAVGDHVMGIVGGGGYAERVAVHERQLIPVPAAVPLADAAAIPEVFLTAWDALVVQGGFTSGRVALVHAGASGVGTAAIQLCKALGGARSRSPARLARRTRAAPSGADWVFERSPQRLARRAVAAVPGGFDVVLDVVGGDELDRNLDVVAPQGTIMQVGLMGGGVAPMNLGKLLTKRLRLIGTTLRNRPLEEKIARQPALHPGGRAAVRVRRAPPGDRPPLQPRRGAARPRARRCATPTSARSCSTCTAEAASARRSGRGQQRALPHGDGLAGRGRHGHHRGACARCRHAADACSPTSSLRPRRSAQNGASAQWAEPVTGSSSTPTLRRRRSGSRSRCRRRSPGAVTATARASMAAMAARSGCSAAHLGCRPQLDDEVEAALAHAVDLGRAEGAAPGRRRRRSAWRAAPGSPSRSSRRRRAGRSARRSGCGRRRRRRGRWAEASVACPQRATSAVGVNQRRSWLPSPGGTRNAVSDRFISAATRCIQPSVTGVSASSRQTAAGLPRKASAVKASTTAIGIVTALTVASRPVDAQGALWRCRQERSPIGT